MAGEPADALRASRYRGQERFSRSEAARPIGERTSAIGELEQPQVAVRIVVNLFACHRPH